MSPLSEVFISIRNGMNVKQGKSSDGLPITRIETISKGIINPDRVGYAGLVREECEEWLLKDGDILFSHINSVEHIGKCAIYQGQPTELVHGMNLLRLRADQDVLDAKYAVHAMRAPGFRARIMPFVNRAVNQASISISNLKSVHIPLPSLKDQARIAAVLDQVDALRAKRRQAIALLDDLTQSIFLGMFGDQLTVRDSVVPLSSVADISSGITKGRTAPAGDLTTLPYLAVANVQDRHLNLSNVKEIAVSPEEKERYELKVGDLLLTEGGDPDKLGRGTLWGGELPVCLHQNHIFRVRVSETDLVDPLYLNWVVSSDYGKRYFLRTAKQTTGIASINKTQLGAFPLPIPSLTSQQDFRKQVEEVAAQQQAHRAHLAVLDELFTSLQHRAFSGTLWDHEAAA